MVDEMIEKKILLAPISERKGRGLSVYLVVPEGVVMSAGTKELYDWILEEVK